MKIFLLFLVGLLVHVAYGTTTSISDPTTGQTASVVNHSLNTNAVIFPGASPIPITIATPLPVVLNGPSPLPISGQVNLITGFALESGGVLSFIYNQLISIFANQTNGTQLTQVTNFPSPIPTQIVSGTVNIGSFPSPLPVTVVSPLPISGHVSVDNFPSPTPIQSVSIVSPSPLPIAGNVTVVNGFALEMGGVLSSIYSELISIFGNQTSGSQKTQVTNFPSPTPTQTITGTVNISSFPSPLPITVISPLPISGNISVTNIPIVSISPLPTSSPLPVTLSNITKTIIGVQTGIDVNVIDIQDRSGTGNITTLNGSVSASSNGDGSVFLNITGTFVANLQIQGQDGNGNWFATPGIDPATGNFSTNPTVDEPVIVPCGGYSQIRVIALTYTSGTVIVNWNAGNGSNYVNQGVPLNVGSAWPVKLTDGTNIATVKPASTAAVATDPAAVVAISPNNIVGVNVQNFPSPVPTQTVTIAGPSPLPISGNISVINIPTVSISPIPTASPIPVTANAGVNLNTSALALAATQTNGTQQTKITDGTNIAVIKAGSTQSVLSDNVLVTTGRPDNVGTPTQTSVSCAATSTTLIAAGTATQFLSFRNPTTSTVTIWFNAAGVAAVVGVPSYDLPPGSEADFFAKGSSFLPTDQFNCISSGTASSVSMIYK